MLDLQYFAEAFLPGPRHQLVEGTAELINATTPGIPAAANIDLLTEGERCSGRERHCEGGES